MATKVVVKGAEQGGFEEKNDVALEAVLTPDTPQATAWSWAFKGKGAADFTQAPDDQQQSSLEFLMAADHAGSYKAIATVNGKPVESEPVEVSLTVPGGDDKKDKPNGSATDPPPVWHLVFAVVAAVVVIGLGFWFFTSTDLLADGLGLQAAAVAKMTTRELLAARMFGVLLLLGGVVLLVGLWMVAVEWRGRFVVRSDSGGVGKGLSLPGQEVLETLAKLKGAGQVLLTGLVIVLAAAWIGAAAVPNPSPASGASTPSSAPGTATGSGANENSTLPTAASTP